VDRTSLECRHSHGTVRLSAESPPPRHPYVPPRPLAVWAFERYFRSLFARHFATVRWATLTDTTRWDRTLPTLLIANHTNWWDGFLSFLLARQLGLTFHILMDATELQRYRAFRWIGVLPVRRGVPREAWADLHRAGACLRAGTGLWIYPQGERRPHGQRPGRFARGAAQLALAHGQPVRVVPVGFRYVFVSEQLPEAFALVGHPRLVGPGCETDRRGLTALLERDTLDTLGALDALLAEEAHGSFRTLVAGRLSVNKRMDRFRHAIGLLRGPFEARNG
jgi:1-acyl-sn-glycerol-3-phosphate acyltransferase